MANLYLVLFTFIAATLASAFASNSLVARQFNFGTLTSGAKPSSVEEIQPRFNKSAKRQIIQWGPYKLQPAGSKRTGFHLDANGDSFSGKLEGICKDCMFLSGSTYLTYENGSRADVATGVYNHHVAVFDLGKSSAHPVSCGSSGGDMNGGTIGTRVQPQGQSGSGLSGLSGLAGLSGKGPEKGGNQKRQLSGMSQLFGSGDDGIARVYYASDSNLKTGFYIGKSDTLFHTSEFVNYKNYTQTVFITADVEWIPGKPEGYIDASMGGMSATGCLGPGYFPPKERRQHVATSPPYTVSASGYMFNVHAHLHDGGIKVILKKNGDLICESQAIYGGEKGTTAVGNAKWETIQDYSVCTKPFEVKIGDKLVVEATYDTEAHQLRPGATDHSMGAEAMGMIAFVFAKKN